VVKRCQLPCGAQILLLGEDHLQAPHHDKSSPEGSSQSARVALKRLHLAANECTHQAHAGQPSLNPTAHDPDVLVDLGEVLRRAHQLRRGQVRRGCMMNSETGPSMSLWM
jgi:hypothetical protein